MFKKTCCFFFALLLCTQNLSAARRMLYVSGETVMINAEYEGVLISGSFEFQLNDQTISTHPNDSIQVGDLIVSAEGTSITSCTELNRKIATSSISTSSLDVQVKRENELKNATLYLYFDESENAFKTGFYIKDHISGVGTLTYYDPQTKTFAALGHEIAEKATGKTADIHQGTLELGNVIQIKPSLINQPGEKVGRSLNQPLGQILLNNEFGLYGKTIQPFSYRMMEIGLQNEITTGSATILSVIDSTQIEEFTIQITRVHYQTTPSIKGIEFQITDQRLIDAAGGIVQGMSGSPILQNGRIIGAVTHMIPSSPTKGYGIFIEWMLMNSDQIQ